MGDGCLKDLADFDKQPLELARCEFVYTLGWIDACLKQDLVGIDVADTGDDCLIHQHRFHITLDADSQRS